MHFLFPMHEITLAIKMVIYLVCFDLSATVQQQQDQICYWLHFIHSSIPNLPQLYTTPDNDRRNWRVLVIGLKYDLLRRGNDTLTPKFISSWQSDVPNPPLYHHKLFKISSKTSKKGVKELLDTIKDVCSQIFEGYSVLIPTSFKDLLLSITQFNSSHTNNSQLKPLHSSNHLLSPIESLHKEIHSQMDMSSFKHALQYLHTIGRIVFLQNGLVCAEPTIIPKLLAKFICPKEVRIRTLSKHDVQILNQKEIGAVLKITNDEEKYSHHFTIYKYINAFLSTGCCKRLSCSWNCKYAIE